MLIERVELRHIKMKLLSPFETSMGVETFEEHIIVRVNSEGITGWGECAVENTPLYSYETVQTAWHVLKDILIPLILGKNINNIEEYINAVKRFRGHRMAKAGLEFALTDLISKSKGVSLSKFLGGTRDRVEVGVSIGLHSSVNELLDKIAAYLNDGYKRIKIKIAPGRDIDLVKAVRKEYPDILFQVDANSAYTLKDIGLFKEMDDYKLLLIEQPLGYEDIYEHSKLQRELRTAICLDESIHSIEDARAAVELGSCKVINIKSVRVGGLREAMLIHDYCESQNIPVWHGGMLESGIGRACNLAAASLPNFKLPGDISASKRYYSEDIVDPPFEIDSEGTMLVPKEPGIGVYVNLNKLEKVTVYKKEFGFT